MTSVKNSKDLIILSAAELAALKAEAYKKGYADAEIAAAVERKKTVSRAKNEISIEGKTETVRNAVVENEQ